VGKAGVQLVSRLGRESGGLIYSKVGASSTQHGMFRSQNRCGTEGVCMSDRSSSPCKNAVCQAAKGGSISKEKGHCTARGQGARRIAVGFWTGKGS
jgi:hypothetical protein